MRVRLLGPFEVEADGRPLALGRRRERALLALLVLDAGRVVAVDRLVTLLWEGDPPPQARRALHVHVARLRAVLASTAGLELTTVGPGYRLDVDPDSVDVHRFRRLLAQARAEPELVRRAGRLAEALRLWRGPALSDVAGAWLRQQVCGDLEEQRQQAREEYHAAELATGRHADLLAELTPLSQEHPHRQRLRALLMLALYRAGRQVESLELYRATRASLVEQFGLEPGALLNRAHDAVLRADDQAVQAIAVELATAGGRAAASDRTAPPVPPPAPAPVPAPAPAQLPADVAGFTGRAGELAALDRLRRSNGGSSGAVVISALSGTPGVGKTALAVHWAHLVRDGFPDGQLYVNLRGYDRSAPIRPVDALSRFLRALGLPADRVPDDVDEAAALYRSLLAGRRVLVVLDNAASPDQVRPLLPGSPTCLVVLTSRDTLSGLVARDGARQLDLGVLSPVEAQDLLATLVGPQLAGAEPDAVAELCRLCAYLPLALRIAAASVGADPHRRLSDYVRDLRSNDPLTALAVDGDERSAVATAFDLSYAALPDPVRHLFRLLGLVPGPDVTVAAAAATAGTDEATAARLLGRLATAHLLDQPAPGRFATHDLLRAYAAARAESEETAASRAAAVARYVDHHLSIVDAAARLLYPERVRLPAPPDLPSAPAPFDGPAGATAWLDANLPNLVDLATGATQDRPQTAWLLADWLHGYQIVRHADAATWAAVAAAGLGAAERAGDLSGQAAVHLSLASLASRRYRHHTAVEHGARSLELSRRAGLPATEVAALIALGMDRSATGPLDRAAGDLTTALDVLRRHPDPAAAATVHRGLGLVRFEQGRLARALEHTAQALAFFEAAGGRRAHAVSLFVHGIVVYLLGRLREAIALSERAIAIHEEIGDRFGLVNPWCLLTEIYVDLGRYPEAIGYGEAAVGLGDAGQRLRLLDALNGLGIALYRAGRGDEAAERHSRVLRLATPTGEVRPIAAALIGLAAVHRRDGELDRARGCAGRAHEVARNAGFGLLEADALVELAAVDLASGARDAAADTARRAVALHERSGWRVGEARARLVLAAAGAPPVPGPAAGRLFAELGVPEEAEHRALLTTADAARR